MTGTRRLDLHVHSEHSPDSKMRLEAIVGQLGRAGLSGFALTDHNSVRGHAELHELQRRNPAYLFVPGVEVSTAEGHLLAYGVASPPPPHRPISDTIDWVRANGGEAVLAHPFRRSHGVGRRVAETVDVRAIEVRNGHNSELANAWAEFVASERGLGHTGGSDAHAPRDVGRASTLVRETADSVDDLLEDIHANRTLAEGISLTPWGQVRVTLRNLGLRAARGFRGV